jgi:DNA-binding NarL/FixJ family response regulator
LGTRVVLARLPGILLGVLRQILDQPDLEVVGVVEDPAMVLGTVERTSADVVVLGEDGDSAGVAARVVERHPGVNVLAVTPDARQAFLYRLRPTRTALGELSPDRLLTAIRAPGDVPPTGAETPT